MKGRVLNLKTLSVLMLLVLFADNLLAESIEVRNVAELVKPADLIARVTVVSVRETGATEGFGKIAWVRVSEAVKGIETGEFFEVENDLVNIVCPNVKFEVGEDVLLFAVRQPSGRYIPLYADAGKIPIRAGKAHRHPFKEGQSYESAVAEVRAEIKKLEDLAASRP